MKTMSKFLLTTLAGVVMLGAGACTASLTSERFPDSGVESQGPTVDPFPPVNATIAFNWYAFGDGVGPNANAANGADMANSDCILKGGFPASACSVINNPSPGLPFPPDASGSMCTDGTAALVLTKGGNPDYSDLWGAGIGSDFGILGEDGGAKDPSVNAYKDLSAYAGVSFDFSGFLVPVSSMRVRFPFQGQHGGDAPYWDGGGDAAMASSPLTGTPAAPQHIVIHWADVGGPFYLTQEVPPVDVNLYPFNPSAVQAIQFQVFTNANTVTPYAFCVSNLALLVK